MTAEKGTVTITQDNYTKSLLERYGMGDCNLRYTPGGGSDLFLDQPEGKLLNKEDTQRFQAITDSVMYLGLVVRYDISYSVNQLTRAMPKSSKSHMAATKNLLRYLAGTTDFTVRYKQGGFNLTTFSDANWGNNPDNGKPRSPYLVFLASVPISFNVGLQELTDLVATALIMKEAMFCSSMMKELGFGTRFDSVPLHLDNSSTLHGRKSKLQSASQDRSAWLLLRAGTGEGTPN